MGSYSDYSIVCGDDKLEFPEDGEFYYLMQYQDNQCRSIDDELIKRVGEYFDFIGTTHDWEKKDFIDYLEKHKGERFRIEYD